MSSTRVQRLYLMQLGVTTIPTSREPFVMSSGCYLAQTSDGRNILIDSGLPAGYGVPGTPPAEDQKNVLEHLADLHLKPEDINMVICTHFDVDHAGYHDSFPQAEFVVQRRHYELAKSGHERYRLVDGDIELLPGLRLIETSGHAPGHQSVLVELPQTGLVLLAIDAVVMERLFTPERHKWPTDDNEEQLRASTQKLLDLVEREQVALVVFGHDGLQWQKLRRAPEWYE